MGWDGYKYHLLDVLPLGDRRRLHSGRWCVIVCLGLHPGHMISFKMVAIDPLTSGCLVIYRVDAAGTSEVLGALFCFCIPPHMSEQSCFIILLELGTCSCVASVTGRKGID